MVLHAYRDRRDGSAPGSIHLSARVGVRGLIVVVGDDGVGMTPRTDSPGLGLGMALIGQHADALEIHQLERGTRVVMRFHRR